MSLVFIIMQLCVCIDVLADGIWSAQKTAKVNILDVYSYVRVSSERGTA